MVFYINILRLFIKAINIVINKSNYILIITIYLYKVDSQVGKSNKLR